MQLLDALTLQSVDAAMDNHNPTVAVTLQPGQSRQVAWPIEVPANLQAVTYRIIAKAGEHSDGEEMTLPVLLNSKLVTEALPLSINGNTAKTFQFDKLLQSGNSSSTLRHHKLTLEFTLESTLVCDPIVALYDGISLRMLGTNV